MDKILFRTKICISNLIGNDTSVLYLTFEIHSFLSLFLKGDIWDAHAVRVYFNTIYYTKFTFLFKLNTKLKKIKLKLFEFCPIHNLATSSGSFHTISKNYFDWEGILF